MDDSPKVLALANRVTEPLPTFSNRDVTFKAIPCDQPEDIYKVLNLDPKTHFVYVYNNYSSQYRRPANSNECNLALAIIEESSFHHHYYCRSTANVLIPSGNMAVMNVEFRGSKSYEDACTAALTISCAGMNYPLRFACETRLLESKFGMVFEASGDVRFGEQHFPYGDTRHLFADEKLHPISFGSMRHLQVKHFRNAESIKNLFTYILRTEAEVKWTKDPGGIKKVFDRMAPFYKELCESEEVFLMAAYHTVLAEIKRTINGVKVSKFFNTYFEPVSSYGEFKAKLQAIFDPFINEDPTDWRFKYYKFDELFPKFSGYAELRKTAIHSQSGRALNKMMADIEFLDFDEESFPLLASLIKDGSIPISTFFRKEGEEAYFLFNNNWPLFEEFLGKHRQTGIDLARMASQRTTYEKSFMSYMYFVLYALPEYLKKHTGKDWTCLPKIVESASELEPERSADGKTSKKRSALTPTVDNKNNTVVVPYACLQVAGRSTTYTYSLNYSLIERGLSVNGDVCLIDIEKQLNGRDDYGLMFYTLTGSAPGRGYPSFLIIFEQLANSETRVHFHRVHPLRSKDGDGNPVNNWIRTCYNWMVGNINKDRIVAQQGDLVFVSIDSLPEGAKTTVDSYDSHCFRQAVIFVPYTKKAASNILGYFEIAAETVLGHPEHMAISVPAGVYELRQCRSWEANPKGIWTLRID